MVTVAPGTTTPEGSTTFPSTVKTRRAVVVVDGVVVVVVSRTVVEGAAITLVAGPPVSGLVHPNTAMPRTRMVSKRSLVVSFTPPWYVSGPA
jgi:hypothetical protein